MKTTFTKLIYPVVMLLVISSLCSCSSKLSRDKAEKLLTEKYKFPYADMVTMNYPQIKIWTQDWDWGIGGYDQYGCKNMCKPSVTVDDIIASGKYSNLVGFSTKNMEDWKKTYVANGDFELYKKYKNLGLIQFQSVTKGEGTPMHSNGTEARGSWEDPTGFYWNCTFSLTPKANQLGINNWQYKAADWVLDDIKGIFNNEANKTADVEFTIKIVKPTEASNLLGGWTEKKQDLKASFKLYDDGWRIEQ